MTPAWFRLGLQRVRCNRRVPAGTAPHRPQVFRRRQPSDHGFRSRADGQPWPRYSIDGARAQARAQGEIRALHLADGHAGRAVSSLRGPSRRALRGARARAPRAPAPVAHHRMERRRGRARQAFRRPHHRRMAPALPLLPSRIATETPPTFTPTRAGSDAVVLSDPLLIFALISRGSTPIDAHIVRRRSCRSLSFALHLVEAHRGNARRLMPVPSVALRMG